ncbi:hypothetical protein BSU04_14660 [Caballeronia sordidicola]|uniref:Uncharacterized protein n=1 Tax=Caballeronia sordidicola TaxID=196367 RepID=A0A226X4V2_CABSO|nr:hypothetical protein BSU04_14660 [Caballeronia sordidicola]
MRRSGDQHFDAIAASAIASAHEHGSDLESQGNRKDVPPST